MRDVTPSPPPAGYANAETFGATGDGATDDYAAIRRGLDALAADGATLLFQPGKTYLYGTVLALPPHAWLRGRGRSTVLKGPGLSSVFPVDTNGDANNVIDDLMLDGQAHVASGRGLDLQGASMVTLRNVKFLGYKDQIVASQCQRLFTESCEHVANTGTRSGLWLTYGTDARAGVTGSWGATNIVTCVNDHYAWANASSGYAIVDDAGLQHRFEGVQISYGASCVRMGQGEATFANCDFEFSSGDTIASSATSLGGLALGKAQLAIGPGNYFDSQVDLTNVETLTDIGNVFHLANKAVYRNCESAQAIFSLGSANVSFGGSLFDANPSGNLFTCDRTGIATLRNMLLGFAFRANGSTGANPQFFVSTLPSNAPAWSTNYGFGIDNAGNAAINAKSGQAVQTMFGGTVSSVLDDGSGNARLKGNLGVGNSASGSTLGTVTNKIQVFDANGNSLGYLPVYDAIT